MRAHRRRVAQAQTEKVEEEEKTKSKADGRLIPALSSSAILMHSRPLRSRPPVSHSRR
jgi:hypothetical protein